MQRLFRDPETAAMIKRCNDYGAGGVCVAIGKLAEGVRIDLDKVPKNTSLDGTELAISESQERMAVVVDSEDAERFIRPQTARIWKRLPSPSLRKSRGWSCSGAPDDSRYSA